MHELLESIATLSGLRDRHSLKAALARLVFQVVGPEQVATWRRVEDDGVEQWMLALRVGGQQTLSSLADQRRASLPLALPDWQGIDEQADLGCRATRWYALRCGSDIVGAMEVTAEPGLDEEKLRQLRAIVRIVSNLRTLIEENECDELTGLLNRKTFDESFGRIAFAPDSVPQIDMARTPVGVYWALGVLDIDHFKRINDGFGHLIGDEVLLLLSQLMRNTLRADDQIYRFGGEEFVVLLRTGNPASAQVAFERIRRAVEAQDFPRVGRINVSIGFTTVQSGDTPNDAFGRADQAVYWVKKNGRNQVRPYEQLLLEGSIVVAEAEGGVEFF